MTTDNAVTGQASNPACCSADQEQDRIRRVANSLSQCANVLVEVGLGNVPLGVLAAHLLSYRPNPEDGLQPTKENGNA